MEVFGAFLDQEWESLSNMFSFEDDSDHHHFLLAPSADHIDENAAQINGNNYSNIIINNNNNNNNNTFFFPCDHDVVDQNTPFYFPGRVDEDISFRASDNYYGGDVFHDYEKVNDAFEPIDFIVPCVSSDDAMAEMWCEKLGNADDYFVGMQPKRKLDTPDNYVPESPKKVARVSRESNKSKRNPRSKKSKKLDDDVQITNNVGEETKSPSTCSSEEGESNGKSKAGKGPATDPQSIYARKRRERINERLKTLQTLVPNGTKVDISTMLEEAVDYVKFLQLQIKLLSSDDMWMFAPIAYNGMDMGLYQKIIPN